MLDESPHRYCVPPRWRPGSTRMATNSPRRARLKMAIRTDSGRNPIPAARFKIAGSDIRLKSTVSRKTRMVERSMVPSGQGVAFPGRVGKACPEDSASCLKAQDVVLSGSGIHHIKPIDAC